MRRLLLALAEPPERFSFRLAWSSFRRHHQATAKGCHATRRARQHPACPGIPQIQALRAGNLDLSDDHWARVSPLLPPRKPETGRPNHDHRTILAGMLWVARTGSSWREIPGHFGPWQTIRSRYERWRKAGIWQRVLEALEQEPGLNGQ